MKQHLEQNLARWFARHWTIIGRHEALELGMSSAQIRARVDTGAWEVVHPGVYRLAGASPDPLSALRAAVVVGGRTAVVSHRSAAWLWNMRDQPPARPTITVPQNRRVRIHGLDVVRSRNPPTPHHQRGLPCTDAIRTLLDSAALADPSELDDLVDRALARRIIKIETLERAAGSSAYRCHPGRALFVQRLELRGVAGSPHPSVLESRMGRVFRRHRLPVPKAEVKWGPDRRYRLDFAYPPIRLAIEVDGWAAHMTPEKRRADQRRTRELEAAGWTVLRYDWWEVTHDEIRVAAEIAATYARLAAAA